MATNTPHRTLINIVGLIDVSGDEILEVIVTSWNRHRVVRLPSSKIPDELLYKLKLELEQKNESWLIACVNTGADKAEDLYFSDFEPAPELDENDGLG